MAQCCLASHFTYLIFSSYAYLKWHVLRRAGVVVISAQCIPEMPDWHIDRAIGYPVRFFVGFVSISRKIPGYYTSLQRPLPSKSSSNSFMKSSCPSTLYNHESLASSKNNRQTIRFSDQNHADSLQQVTFTAMNSVYPECCRICPRDHLQTKCNAASKISQVLASVGFE